jgi:hypothetical protein
MQSHICPARRKSAASSTLLGGGFVFIVVVLLYSGIMGLIVKQTGLGVGRINQAREHLAHIAHNPSSKKIVIVYGSSLVHAGFSPDTFDSEMGNRGIDSVSYNFGFDGLNPEFQHLFAKRVKEEFQRSGRQIDVVLIEFNPFQTTLARKDHDRSMSDQWYASFCSPAELWDITLKNPQRGTRLFGIRYLRNGVSSELVTSALRLALKLHDPTLPSDDYAEVLTQRRRLKRQLELRLKKDLGELYGHQWNTTFRGARMSRKYLSKDTIDLHQQLMNSLRHPVRLEQDLRRRIKFCDIVKLVFDGLQIDEFIDLVRTFQSVSRQVEVILLPQNDEWIQNPPETKRRLNQVLSRIRTETRAIVKNYQAVPEIDATHFSDTTHLTPIFGSELFSRILARDMKFR